MSTPTTKVLMSAGNPTGRKLEELLIDVAEDLRIKNDILEGDASPTSRAIRINNLGILDCLALAGVRQLDTLRRLDLIGPDQGPGGTPRIGVGTADVPASSAGITHEPVAAPTVTSGPDLVVPASAVLPAV